jgi:hypothetical protein
MPEGREGPGVGVAKDCHEPRNQSVSIGSHSFEQSVTNISNKPNGIETRIRIQSTDNACDNGDLMASDGLWTSGDDTPQSDETVG